MKITDAKVFVTSPGRNFVTLKVYTDAGIYGLGDATLNGRELAVASYLRDHVIPCLIGRDPSQTEDVWQYLYRGAYWRRGPVTMTAIAAVDMALWDVKGKALVIYWSYESEREDYEDDSAGATIKGLASVFMHFFTKTRWDRLGHFIH